MGVKEEEGGGKIMEYVLSVCSPKYLAANGHSLLQKGLIFVLKYFSLIFFYLFLSAVELQQKHYYSLGFANSF